VKATLRYAVASALLLAVLGVVLVLAYGADVQRAIVWSALVSFVTQLVGFAIVRRMAKQNVIAGWGLGAILRFVVFVIWALVCIKSLGLPSAAAMVSLAVFLFASTLVEPLFLQS
jgi:uncharacterized protein YybS (DUF2232 family)